MKNSISIIFGLLLLLTMASCKSKKVVRNDDFNLLKTFWLNQQDFDFLSLRGKATISNNGQDQTANITIWMKRDSVIWLRAGLMGFEGVRAIVTKDSLKVVNRLNQSYMSYGVDALEQFLGFKMTLAQAQNLLIGNALFAQDQYSQFDSSVYLKARLGDITNTIKISDKARLESAKYTSSNQSQTSETQYDDYDKFESLFLPKLINTSVQRNGTNSKVVINYQSAHTRPISNFPFSIPDGYKKSN